MNGKVILLFILCINFAALMYTSACGAPGATCSGFSGTDTVLGKFFSLPSNVYAEGHINASAGITDSAEAFQNPQAGVEASEGTGLRSFIDGLRMVGVFLSLLTPLPTLYLIGNIGVPLFVTVLLGLVIVILYLASIAEFIRGAKF